MKVDVQRQPDDVTCGPTCLHAIYGFYRDVLPLEQVIHEVESLSAGGTLAVRLACHALRRGYRATIFTYNLQVFDPTWFQGTVDVPAKLRAQVEAKPDARLAEATRSYIEFLERGGVLRHTELTRDLIRRTLAAGKPILAGLSATYLYDCARERGGQYDDVRGEPMGHFVVLSGYDRVRRRVQVADPLHDNPRFGRGAYAVGLDRLLTAILLGIVTYDANLLVVEPGAAAGKAAEGR